VVLSGIAYEWDTKSDFHAPQQKIKELSSYMHKRDICIYIYISMYIVHTPQQRIRELSSYIHKRDICTYMYISICIVHAPQQRIRDDRWALSPPQPPCAPSAHSLNPTSCYDSKLCFVRQFWFHQHTPV